MKKTLPLLPILFLIYWGCEEEQEPEDCAGVAGGNAVEDNCGVCDADPSNDCVEDCAGIWDGNNICGCTDSIATNYDSTATFDDESCEYDTVDCTEVETYYTENVAPILESNCTGCHSGPTPRAGLSLDSYSVVFIAIKSGEVWDRVNRDQGTNGFMPNGGTKLSDANLEILQTFFEMECDE